MRDDLRVPKQPTPARVTLSDGSVLDVSLFLAGHEDRQEGRERVTTLLESEQPFVPARRADGTHVFLRRAGIAAVRVPAASEADVDAQTVLPVEIDVRVTLAGGVVLQGFVTFVRPDSSARLVDHLNDGTGFLRLMDGADVVIVNKAYVTLVEPVGA